MCRKSSTAATKVIRETADPVKDEDPRPEPVHTPVKIGKYTHAIHHRNGIFSEVYKAVAPNEVETPTRHVALKVTTPSMMVAPHDSQKEARILESLQRKRNVSPLIETFRLAGDRFVLVFPFFPLSVDMVQAQGDLDETKGRTFLGDMLTALAHLHSNNIIHRDVKPSNLLLRSLEGPVFLSDFGISWSAEDPASEQANDKITDVGTTCYRPPEILFGKKDYDYSLDMWAAGCTAAELVTPTPNTLFQSGHIGTELALIQSIFMTLGTPDETIWPGAVTCPDWGKMEWKQFPLRPWTDILPNASPIARDLVSSLICYEPTLRTTAVTCRQHAYFKGSEE